MYDIEWIYMSKVFGWTEIMICFTTAMSVCLRFVFRETQKALKGKP